MNRTDSRESVSRRRIRKWAGALAAIGIGLMPFRGWAHCDSLEGPVVKEAREALAAGDPTAVLKWVKPEREAEIREAFRQTLAVRSAGEAARELADRFFFETLVRIHRAGEGEGFTGLKPAGGVDPGIAAAEEALAAGSAEALAKRLAEAVREGVERRFRVAAERRRHASESVEAGREYVEAYVQYIHFVEGAHRLAAAGPAHAHHEGH